MNQMKLYGIPGWGSAIVEFQLAWYGMEYTFEVVGDLFEEPEAREQLASVNPLAQVPTLIMPDDSVMTESAAITLLLAEMAGDDALVPSPGSVERAEFLRWLVFIVANIYPTYTYGDDPSRFVENKDAQKPFREAVSRYARKLYSQLEGVARGPWFLGERFSAIDIYLSVLTNWQPKPPWFEGNTPKLFAAAQNTAELEPLRAVYERNFSGSTTQPTT